MRNYFVYFPCGPRELEWGFHVSAAGFTRIRPGGTYPLARHPDDHAFDWSRGRILGTFQLVLLSGGEGWFEIAGRRLQKVRQGQCFFLFPGVWHRYRPDPRTGWTEHWFEVHGELWHSWLACAGVSPSSPVATIRSTESLLAIFRLLHAACLEKKPGFRPVLASFALAILAEAAASRSGAKSRRQDAWRGEIRRFMERASGSSLSVRRIARESGVSYPTFLRRFRKETGLSPKDYLEQLRIVRAEELLADESLSIKEVAHRLGYSSAFHFSRNFKQERGVAPLFWRRQRACRVGNCLESQG